MLSPFSHFLNEETEALQRDEVTHGLRGKMGEGCLVLQL